MENYIIYRTSGSPSAWSQWYFSDHDTIEDTSSALEADIEADIEARFGSLEEFLEESHNSYYPTFQVGEIEADSQEIANLLLDEINGCQWAPVELEELGIE